MGSRILPAHLRYALLLTIIFMPRQANNTSPANRPARAWCFTLNNPTESGEELAARMIADRRVRYVIFQKEVGEAGTPHYQGYVEFKQAMRMSTVKTLISPTLSAYLDRRRGNRDQAKEYASKDDTRVEGPWEAGVWNTRPGRRTDIDAVMQTLGESRSLRQTAIAHPNEWLKFHRGLESWYSMTQPSRPIAPIELILLYGKTGTGKTKRAFEQYQDLFRKAPDTRWFDGYTDQQTLLLDDFGGKVSKVSLTYLLQLLDIYPMDVEVKGGYRPLLATRIIITTNIHPRLWYDYSRREEQYQALMRRFSALWYYPAAPAVPIQVDHDCFTNQWAEYCNEDQLFHATQDTDSE